MTYRDERAVGGARVMSTALHDMLVKLGLELLWFGSAGVGAVRRRRKRRERPIAGR